MSRRDVRQTRRAGMVSIPIPRQLLNLTAWYRADLGITLNGSNVSAWADQSGTGDSNKNATQGTGANQPPYVTSSAMYGNQPVVNFTGAGMYLGTGIWASALVQPSTVMSVGHTTSNSANAYFHDSLSGNRMATSDASGANVNIYADTATIGSGVGTLNMASVCFSIFNVGSSSIAVRTKTPQTTGNPGSHGLASLCIGNTGASAFANSLLGPLAELAIWSRVLSASEIAALASYVTARYGIAVGA
jgi:hypothetical protein